MTPLKHFTLAIDGPGGAGKSSVAKNVAERLGVLHLDTGAMYRAFAYQALREGLDSTDGEAMAELTRRVTIDVRFLDGCQHTFANGEDVTALIRTPEISMATSNCAVFAPVRALMVRMQQDIASKQSMVLDGRDIGTRVLPQATLKIYLTASTEVRARRRYEELEQKGIQADYDHVLSDVAARDLQDSTRQVDPLSVAPDAVTLDTSTMTQPQVEAAILDLLEKKLMQKKPKAATEPFTLFYRLAMWASYALFHTLYPVRYHHAERAKMDAPFILIGNHNSMLDPLLIGWKCKRYQIRYLGKKELIRNPLMRAMYTNMLIIPVDRHNMDMHAVRECLKVLTQKHILGIFPEGTRHKKTMMQEMESGVAMIALRGNVPVLPAYITGKPKFLRPIDCYYGEPFTVTEFAAQGINREACNRVMEKITETYRGLAQTHENP